MKNDGFAERLRGMSEDALKKMLEAGLKEYTPEALAAAREELERRGEAGEAYPAEPLPAEPAPAAGAPGGAAKPSRWGVVLVVVGAFFVYATALFGVLAMVRSNLRLRVETGQIIQVLVYAVIAFVCVRAGARRKPNWQVLFGGSLLVLAILAYAGLSSLARQRPGTLMPKVIVPTVVILAALGVLSLAAAFIKKSYTKG